ncbi:MAG TPA: hypothetical protein PKM95_10750 [Deltaproteobacteria bacterium]|nr:hypothetical protein [Deltaproteobacteria bacterium]
MCEKLLIPERNSSNPEETSGYPPAEASDRYGATIFFDVLPEERMLITGSLYGKGDFHVKNSSAKVSIFLILLKKASLVKGVAPHVKYS